MNETSLWRRYALALALVPDVDVAGDLFMDARSDEALLRRAAAWRRRHGLPPVAAVPPELPDLTPEQQEDALHLYRRARRRRRVQLGLAAVVAVAVLLGSIFLAVPDERSSLAADPAFAGRPLVRSEEKAGRRLAVFKAEATAGAVTVWWEITGPRLSAGITPGPELVLSGSGSDWRDPMQTWVKLVRPDRLVGRSTYNVLVGEEEAAVLHLDDLAGEPVRWLVRAPLTRAEVEPDARVLHPDSEAAAGNVRFTVRQVTVAPTYTLVRYEPDTGRQRGELRHFLRVEADGFLLELVGPPRVEGREVVALFRAAPSEADELVVHFDRAAAQHVDSVPARNELTGTTWSGSTVTAQLALSTFLVDRYTTSPLPLSQWPWNLGGSFFLSDDGVSYPAMVVYQGEDPSRHLTLWRLQAYVPSAEAGRPLQVRIPRLEREPGAEVRIRLTQ
jgi:hypothetical protein